MIISEVVGSGSNRVKLTDLYDESELNDESEQLYHFTDPDNFDVYYSVKTISPSDIRKLLTPDGNSKLVDAYKRFATSEQKKLVKFKASRFDHDRIVVLYNNRVVDGNHHLMAGLLSNNDVKFIDISDEEQF